MTTDLERAFEQLRARANTVTLPPAQHVRRRGDRRRHGLRPRSGC